MEAHARYMNTLEILALMNAAPLSCLQLQGGERRHYRMTASRYGWAIEQVLIR